LRAFPALVVFKRETPLNATLCCFYRVASDRVS